MRALGRDARLQELGLAYLTSALVTDMTDVRAAFRCVGALLASVAAAVRAAAAALAYYGADLQGRTAEAQPRPGCSSSNSNSASSSRSNRRGASWRCARHQREIVLTSAIALGAMRSSKRAISDGAGSGGQRQP